MIRLPKPQPAEKLGPIPAAPEAQEVVLAPDVGRSALASHFARVEEERLLEVEGAKPSHILRHGDSEGHVYLPSWYREGRYSEFRERTGFLNVIKDGKPVLRCQAFAVQLAPKVLSELDAFYEYCDNISDTESRMANVLCAGWRASHDKAMFPPFEFGPVVHLHSIVRAPGARPVAWRGLVDEFAKKLAGGATSIQLLKAFELEYDREQELISSEETRLGQRTAALMRIYSRMGFRECSSAWSRDRSEAGWMWRATGNMPGLAHSKVPEQTSSPGMGL
ncbi:hypothetical protein [Xanthobacter flavus]|uniref:hypothetical protein n=1 Tax=Xanthobacter flavus TaxID=281 RepID=UPI00372C8F9F